MRSRSIRRACALTLAAGCAAISAADFGGFAPPIVYDLPSGNLAHDVAMADLDADGDLDVLVAARDAGGGFGGVVMFRNTGGVFATGVRYGVGNDPVGIQAADLDNDGDVDFILSNRNSDDVSVRLNNGDGTFGSEIYWSVGDDPRDVGVGDFNADGILDMAVAVYGESRVKVYTGDGDGTFTFAASYQPGSVGGLADRPYTLTIADVNADGALDILAAKLHADQVAILYGIGNGTFFDGDFTILVPTGDSPYDCKVADVNNDGGLDILIAEGGSDSRIRVMQNQQNAFYPSFSFARTEFVGGRTINFALGDVENPPGLLLSDGDIDIVAAPETTNQLVTLVNNGGGDFTNAQTLSLTNYSGGIALGDVDSDGDLDAIVTLFSTGDMAVYLNQSTIVDGVDPVAQITSPSDFNAGDGCICPVSQSIIGIADVPGGVFGNYVLRWRALGGSVWTTFTTSNLPVTSTGTLGVWNVSALPEGYYVLQLEVTNSSGESSTDEQVVWVSQDLDTLSYTVPAFAGSNICLYGSVHDSLCGGVTWTAEYRPAGGGAWTPVDSDSPFYSGGVDRGDLAVWDSTTVPDGDYQFRVIAENNCGQSRTQTASTTVDNTPPVCNIDSPINCDKIRPLTIDVFGEASDDNIAGWSLSYTGGPANGWVNIASGTSNVSGLIASWDVSDLPPCAYTIRLTVSDLAVLNCDDRNHHSRTFMTSVNVGCPADQNRDGIVDFFDVQQFLNDYASGCP